jgi:hypothetical protein
MLARRKRRAGSPGFALELRLDRAAEIEKEHRQKVVAGLSGDF